LKKIKEERKKEWSEAQELRKAKIGDIEKKQKQILLLEVENLEVTEKLKKRATDLVKYEFKIKDLRKSKHVLTLRT
jgi:hypothetical protein